MTEISDGKLKRYWKVEKAQEAALEKLNRLTSKIEDMEWDCDAEVYEALLDIFDTLNV